MCMEFGVLLNTTHFGFDIQHNLSLTHTRAHTNVLCNNNIQILYFPNPFKTLQMKPLHFSESYNGCLKCLLLVLICVECGADK